MSSQQNKYFCHSASSVRRETRQTDRHVASRESRVRWHLHSSTGTSGKPTEIQRGKVDTLAAQYRVTSSTCYPALLLGAPWKEGWQGQQIIGSPERIIDDSGGRPNPVRSSDGLHE